MEIDALPGTHATRFLILLGCFLLQGCSTGRPLIIEVRDAVTRLPVEGALVRVVPVHFFVPESGPGGSGALLEPWPATGSASTTDDDGCARLFLPGDLAGHLLITGGDVSGGRLVVVLEKGILQPSNWTKLESRNALTSGAGHPWEVRFVKPGL